MTEQRTVAADGAKVFYGWYVALVAMLTLLVSNGMTITGMTIFDPAILQEFGWSRGDLKLRDLLQLGLSGLLAPFIGSLADRMSVRKLMMAGLMLLSLCIAAYSQMTSLTHLYIINVGIALVLALAGLVLNVLIVSRWFVKKRGTALGLTLVGTSLGGIIFPRLGAVLLRTHTWREAMLMEAMIPLVAMMVLALVTRDSPAEMGLQPFGAAGAPGAIQVATGMEYGDAIRTRTFWILTFCAMTTFYCILAAQAHMVLHLKGMGWPLEKAAGGVGILFTMGLVGKFLIGYLADKLERRVVFLSNISIMLAGALCLASMKEALLWPFILIFGLGWGGLYTMLQLTCMDSFGTRAGGKILGTITVLDAIGGGLGIWITGVLFDRSKSYEGAFSLIAGLVFLAFLAALALQNPQAGSKEPAARPA
ncbi:MAG TPA: MFS transporter [Vicinamibacteria bacterium]|nr:MFS transporter [Vicinamibacteria bacterium]